MLRIYSMKFECRLHFDKFSKLSRELLEENIEKLCIYIYIYIYIQGVSRLEDITAGGDFLGICDQKSSYKHVSDFGRSRSYDRLKLRGESNVYLQ